MSLATDPGITYNLYSGQTTYTIPGKKTSIQAILFIEVTTGPSVFTCGGASSPTTSNPLTSTVPTTTSAPTTVSAPTTTSKPATTTVPATTSTAAAGTVVHYGQCGGIGSVSCYSLAGVEPIRTSISDGPGELPVSLLTHAQFQVPTYVRNLSNSVPSADNCAFCLQYSQCL